MNWIDRERLTNYRGFAERVDEIVDAKTLVDDLWFQLTDSEKILAFGVMMGMNVAEAARQMGLTQQTGNYYMCQIRKKYQERYQE